MFSPLHDSTWSTYLYRFHAERPGITERILTRCRADGVNPYQWCAEPITGDRQPVLDLACGSGPLADRLDRWIGLDISAAELRAARDRDRTPLVLASAASLPIHDHAIGTAVCSMGLQLIEPLAVALVELARVLRPEGRAVILVPTTKPIPWRHAATYGRLQIALRQRIRYPNDDALRPAVLIATARKAGLCVAHDERLAFTFALNTEADADELLASMYLPRVDTRGLEAGRRVLRARIGARLTVPLRRIVLERTGATA